MTELRQVYKCNICGNIVDVLHAGMGQLVCCNAPMELMEEKNQDEGLEKHLPIIEKKGDKAIVRVGEVLHPMEEKHFIEWIEVISENSSWLKFLSPGDKPEIEIMTKDSNLTARSFCNVHGLWKNSKVSQTKDDFIDFDSFAKVDLRVAEVIEALPIENSEKLLKLTVLLGEEKRQIIAGISKYYSPENLINKKIIIVANLEPKIMFGEESRGMILAAKDSSNLSVLVLEKDIASGTKLS